MQDVLQCPICLEPFDCDVHRPLLLPACGHTLCKLCLHTGHLSCCPEDRSIIQDWSDLPTNILILRSLEQNSRPPSLGVSSDIKTIASEEVELLERVGLGASGEVYRARYRNKTVAVKVFGTSTSTHSQQHTQPGPASESQLQLPQPQQQKPQQVSRAFLREVEVLHLVSEDALYCARMYGCTFKEGQPCIVMKWFPNGHLRVPPGGYSLPSALQWGTSIAKALAEVHALGIVVADLKPENVLVTEQQDAVLADFGISKRVAGTTGLLAACTSDGSTAAGGVRGTPCYMAPEQWGPGALTNRADVWAWGCLMLELLTGRQPWEGLTADEILAKVATEGGSPALPANLPEGLTSLLQSCFDHKPSARPSCAKLVAALRSHSVAWASEALGQGALTGGRATPQQPTPIGRAPQPHSPSPSNSGSVSGTDDPGSGSPAGGASPKGSAGSKQALSSAQHSAPQAEDAMEADDMAALQALIDTARSGEEEMYEDRSVSQWVALLRSSDPDTQERATDALFSLVENTDTATGQIIRAGGLQALCVTVSSLAAPAALEGSTAGQRSILSGAVGTLSNMIIDEPGCREAIVRAGILPHLVGMLQCQAASAQLVSLRLLHRLARDYASCRDAVVQAGAVGPAVQLLQSADVSTQKTAADLLWCICSESNAGQDAVMAAGAMQPLRQMLASDDSELQRIAAAIVGWLAHLPDGCESIRTAGVLRPLLALVSNADSALQQPAAAAVANVTRDASNAAHAACVLLLVNAGAIAALQPLLLSSEPLTQRYAVSALANISDVEGDDGIRQQLVDAGVLPGIVPLLSSSDECTCRRAGDLLFNISQGDHNEAALAANAIPCLVRQLSSPELRAQRCAAATLGNLCFGQAPSTVALREAGGIAALVRVLRVGGDENLERYAAGALHQAAFLDPPSKAEIREQGGIPPLVELLQRSSDADSIRRAAGALWSCSVDDDRAKAIMCASGAVPALVALLSQPDVQCAAAGMLDNIAIMGQQWALQVREAGGIGPLVQLLRSPKPDLATCAAGVLATLTDDDPVAALAIKQAGGGLLLMQLFEASEDEETKTRAARAITRMAESLGVEDANDLV